MNDRKVAHRRRRIAGLLVLAAAVATGTVRTPAQDVSPLAAARDLYASARYDEALAMLNALRGDERAERRWVEQYRSLCLLALGRSDEAASAIAAVITADPTYRPGEVEASPRVRATFGEVRRRLLPELATARYVTAKGAYDRQEWSEAQREFELVLSLLDDPDMGGRLADLRVLTAGFLELSARAAVPPPTPAPAEPTPAPEAQVASLVPHVPAPMPSGPDPERVYLADDQGVVPPVVVRQDIPRVPANILQMSRGKGLLEVVIDAQGRVVSMAMRLSIHPSYDALLIAAARDWKYQPATLEGHPVRFRKLIQIAVAR